MNESEFRKYLKRGGRSNSAIERCVNKSKEFEHFVEINNFGPLEKINPPIITKYVELLEKQPKYSAKTDLWALIYYFDFHNQEKLKEAAKELRRSRIKKSEFKLKDFRDVDLRDTKKLENIGIINVNQLLEKSKTPKDREDLSKTSGVHPKKLLELVKLSDLSRIGAIKSIRARLYYDAGLQVPDDFSLWEPRELREMLVNWVEETKFDGIVPLPKEIEYAIAKASALPRIIEY